MNIRGKEPFGNGRPRRDKCVAKKFHYLCYENCTPDEKGFYNYDRRPDTQDPAYAQWERQLRNFASGLIRRMIHKYLPIFNTNARKVRTPNKLGKTVGALTDMIGRGIKKSGAVARGGNKGEER